MDDLFDSFKNMKEVLKVDFINVENYFLHFGGEGWSYYGDSNSSWRMVRENKIIYSSEIFNQSSMSSLLSGTFLIDCLPLSDFCLHEGSEQNMNVDIVFKFSNFVELHVFAISFDEPWVFSLPKITFVPYG